MDLKARHMILYRGSLKSCNYRCNYCPFSKHPRSERELLRDREQWFRFCASIRKRAVDMGIGAVMVAPYGEVLIHSWYWEGLGCLASVETIDGVGAQTNLSFPVRQCMETYEKAGGTAETLRLWATFHPEMATAEEFSEKCTDLWKRGVSLCVGAVGDVGNLEAVGELRHRLPKEIYLWINKMDGLKRAYTGKEIRQFEGIDPYFSRELEMTAADLSACRGRLFVEADGTLRRCNISRPLRENWYDLEKKGFPGQIWETEGKEGSCGRKSCSCYLAYGGRDEVMNRVIFGPYSLFRIPTRPKAAFLDIDKTLILQGEGRVGHRTVTDLQALAADGCRLFFATCLPLRDAKKKCRDVWQLFEGGVFAGGAHVVFGREGERREHIFSIESKWIEELKIRSRDCHFRMLVYREGKEGAVYKITLVRPGPMGWSRQDVRDLGMSGGGESGSMRGIWDMGGDQVRWYAQDGCLQIVNWRASKEEGVRMICEGLGISPEEAVAAGDSPEDREMMELCSP